MLGILAGQTRKPDEVIAYCSGYDMVVLADLAYRYPEVTFQWAQDLDDWGHDKRARGLASASSDWVGFFNDDDWYEQTYIERMLDHATDADVVFCAWNEQPGCSFNLGSSTAGNFIVRTEAGKRVGYPGDRVYENDGHFINRLNSHTDRIVKVEDLLYHHNYG